MILRIERWNPTNFLPQKVLGLAAAQVWPRLLVVAPVPARA
jgi:hypothetical protein